MKKIISLIMLFVCSIAAAQITNAPVIDDSIKVAYQSKKTGEIVYLCTNDLAGITDYAKAFHAYCIANGYSEKNPVTETAIETYKINVSKFNELIAKLAAVNDNNIRVWNIGLVIYTIKGCDEAFKALDANAQHKIAIISDSPLLLFGHASKLDKAKNTDVIKFRVTPADVKNPVFFKRHILNGEKYNTRKIAVFKNEFASIGFSKEELRLLAAKAMLGTGFTNINYQKDFIAYIKSLPTKAEKVAILEAEILALLDVLDSNNEEQNAWLTKLRLQKTVYSE